MNHPSDISITGFNYHLPQEKIAAYPLENRDGSKLLIYKNEKISESVFRDLDNFLEAGSVLVFNNTKVIPARLNFLNSKKQLIEIFCLEPAEPVRENAQVMSQTKHAKWNCLVGNLKRWKDEELTLEEKNIVFKARLSEKMPGHVIVDFSWSPETLSFAEVIDVMGRIPIPPYLNRDSEKIDELRYQTIYARYKGSVAAPTAGLHFTEQVLENLKKKGIVSHQVTLHVGAGTFKPVKSQTMRGHNMHSESIEASVDILRELGSGSKMIAVGTTSLRAIESLYWMGVKILLNKDISYEDLAIAQWEVYDLPGNYSANESFEALMQWMRNRNMERLQARTKILIAPPYELKVASGLLTNFHQPQSTLLLLVSTIVGDKWKDVYNYALEHNFRFLSYGDSSLLLK